MTARLAKIRLGWAASSGHMPDELQTRLRAMFILGDAASVQQQVPNVLMQRPVLLT